MQRVLSSSIHITKGLNFKPVRYYDQKVLNYFENPPNVGKLNKKQKNVGTGLVGSIACGDQLKFQVEVNEETGVIDKAVFKAFGCGSAIASSAYATELIKGMHVDDAMNITNNDISSYLNLPPVKLHCSLLAEDAIKKALGDYKEKSKTQGEETAKAF